MGKFKKIKEQYIKLHIHINKNNDILNLKLLVTSNNFWLQ